MALGPVQRLWVRSESAGARDWVRRSNVVIYLKSAAGGTSLILIAFVAWAYSLIRHFAGTSISFSPGVFLAPGLLRIQCVPFCHRFCSDVDLRVSLMSMRTWKKRMRVGIGILAAGSIVAFVARRLVTTSSGPTFTRPDTTIYVPFNIVMFWLSIAVAIILCLVSWASGRKIL
jgi:hypothetical protein